MKIISRRAVMGLFAAAMTLAALPAAAAEVTNYTPDALAAAKASGKPFILDFFATWCVTCAAQHRVLDKLRAENPAYAAIPFIQVDWDQNEHGPLVAAMKIPRRSTLVVLKGDAELGRIVAQTGDAEIEALLKLAL
jgi:thiol:disulfide interchange protein